MKKIILLMVIATITNTSASQLKPFAGFTKQIRYERMIPPLGLEVTFDKTVHILLPSAVRYVDLGSEWLIAGKAEGAENVIRVKSSVKGFEGETNMSVITDDGSFYTFNVRYSEEPQILNVEMKRLLAEAASRANESNIEEMIDTNTIDLHLKELGGDSYEQVNSIMQRIYDLNQRKIRTIGARSFGMLFILKGIYTHNNLIYLHTEMRNNTHIPYDVEMIMLKVEDRKVAKRTAHQELSIKPVRIYNPTTRVGGMSHVRSVYALEKFTIHDNKQLIVEIHEKGGDRVQAFAVRGRDILSAELIE